MDVKITSKKENPLLKRKEVHFQVQHDRTGGTPLRPQVRKAIANALKAKVDLVFVRKMQTKTGTHMADGLANVYDSLDQANLVEPEHIVKRNVPPEKPAEEEAAKKVPPEKPAEEEKGV